MCASDVLTVPNPQYPRRARIVPPLEVQVVHHEDLRDPQVVRIRIELNAAQRPEVGTEEHLRKPAVDVAPARRYRDVLLRREHFLLQRRVVAVAGDAQRAGRDAVECAAEEARVCVEPVRVDGGARSCAQLTCEERASERAVGQKIRADGEEHGHVGLRDSRVGLPFIGHIDEAVCVEEVVIWVPHAVHGENGIVVRSDGRIVKGECEVSVFAT